MKPRGVTRSGLELVITRSKVRVGRGVAVSAPPCHRATGIESPPKAAFFPGLPAGIRSQGGLPLF